MAKTSIAWATDSWNVAVGCSKVSAGCWNCYAARMASRLKAMGRPEYQDVATDDGTWTGDVHLCPERLKEPEHWRKPRRVFVCSMGDLFHREVPDRFINQVFAVMRVYREHTFMVLTKRAARMREWSAGYGEWPRNVWAMVSAEDQAAANERIPDLLRVPAAVHGVSIEPMLGPVDLTGIDYDRLLSLFAWQGRVNWVIVGGESGPYRRPFDPAWALDVYAQCQAAGVPVFLKQGSGPRPGTPLLVDGREVHEWPEGCDA